MKKSSKIPHKNTSFFLRLLPYIICFLFLIAYSVLSIVRHDHYQSYGYDLGINDQTVWRYSTFQEPIATIAPFPDKTKLYEHVELVYAVIAPFYWIWSSRKMLLLVEIACVCSGGIAIYLLAKKRGLKEFLSIALMVGYLAFYGVQNAIWFDVHSVTFAAGFLAWFLYFLDGKKLWRTLLFFLLAITTKENIGLLTFCIAAVYFIKRRGILPFILMVCSLFYVSFIFFVYFPHIIHFSYLYQNDSGLLSNLNPLYLFNTAEKWQTLFYTFLSSGFLSLLNPLYLLPVLGDFGTYFVIASDLPGAQGLFGQYRVTLAPLLAWATIAVITKYPKLNNKYIATYLICCALLVQYLLHLPISYLTKSWFWEEPSGVKNINAVRNYLPASASVVAQNNIVPHLSHRDQIYSLYPEKKHFDQHSPCGKPECNWFHWYADPEFLFIDMSPEWDIRHLLTNRNDFLDGIHNLEKAKVITKYRQIYSAILYKINKNPVDYE